MLLIDENRSINNNRFSLKSFQLVIAFLHVTITKVYTILIQKKYCIVSFWWSIKENKIYMFWCFYFKSLLSIYFKWNIYTIFATGIAFFCIVQWLYSTNLKFQKTGDSDLRAFVKIRKYCIHKTWHNLWMLYFNFVGYRLDLLIIYNKYASFHNIPSWSVPEFYENRKKVDRKASI